MTEVVARLVDKDGQPLGTAANPLKILGGGSGSSKWGFISGDINNQTDLINALALKAPAAEYGYAPLGADGKIPSAYVGQIGVTEVLVATVAPSTPAEGWVWINPSTGGRYIYDTETASWISLADPSGSVTSVNGYSGPAVTLVKADIGLGNVPNLDFSNAANITSGSLSYLRLPYATSTRVGAVKGGSNVLIDEYGMITATGVATDSTKWNGYTLPAVAALGHFRWNATGTAIETVDMSTVIPIIPIQRAIEGSIYESTLMYWVAPSACTVSTCMMYLKSKPATTGYCKVQGMKNGTATTDSIFTSDAPMQISDTAVASNGVYTGYAVLDGARITLAKGDTIWFRVDQATSGCADLFIHALANISS